MQQVPKDSWFSPSLEMRDSPVHGKGTFASKHIKAGEIVEIWGEYWRGKKTVEYTDNKEKIKIAEKQGKSVMYWDTNLFSIEKKGADDGYFINHSCDSNLWFKDVFTLTARKHIKPGEEVTIDYALFGSNDGYVAIPNCRCGASNCRHKITSNDWQNKDVQKKYKNHFSPLLNKMIGEHV